MHLGNKCGKDVVRDDRCIFHLENKNEHEIYLFEKEFRSYVTQSLQDDHTWEVDCTRFVIPITPEMIPTTWGLSRVSQECVFSKHMCFRYAQVYGVVGFQTSAFIKGARADFSYATFHEGALADFSLTGFLEGARVDFSSATFNKNAGVSFSGATFNENAAADFSLALFKGGGSANFSHATFNKNAVANFSATAFSEKAGANFSHATFNEYAVANFLSATFDKNAVAYFSEATFNKNARADFSRATFSEEAEADFSRATFNEDAETTFSRAIFKKAVAYFSEATFNKNAKADFSEAIFKERADAVFSHATFRQDAGATFSRAIFKNTEVDFLDAGFSENARVDFSYSRFLEKAQADFVNARLRRSSFRSLVIDEMAKVRFGALGTSPAQDLSGVSFLSTDLTLVDFGKVTWGTKPAGCIADEHSIIAKDGPSYEHVVTLYRQLRKNYELQLRYTEAANFFVREMELMRSKPRYFEEPPRVTWSIHRLGLCLDSLKESTIWHCRVGLWWLRKWISVLTLYHMVANYGESYWRVVIVSTISILVYGLYGLIAKSSKAIAELTLTTALSGYVEQVTRAFRLYLQVFETVSLDLGDVLFRVWSGLLLAVLYISLRRKLQRRSFLEE
jgi:hypothetical protein